MTLTAKNAKFLSIFLIGIGSFIIGIIPACFVKRRNTVSRKLFLSGLLCFGGGVLLATSLLHMLPETRESLPKYAELVFSCGFLLLYFVDEVAHYFWIKDDRTNQSSHQYHGPVENQNYTNSIRQSRHSVYDCGYPPRNSDSEPNTNFFGRKKSIQRYGTIIPTAPPSPPPPLVAFNEEDDNSFLCHGTHNEPCLNSNTGHFGLAIALTIHSVLEGLAVGLQSNTNGVLLLVSAVVTHKFVVAFCLGLELAESSSNLCSYIGAMFLFCGGSSLGIFLGMLAFEIDPVWKSIVMPVMQGLAAGTLLYVTVSEVLPRERARWHKNSKRSAGLVQFFSVACGFTFMYSLNTYIEQSHHGTGNI